MGIELIGYANRRLSHCIIYMKGEIIMKPTRAHLYSSVATTGRVPNVLTCLILDSTLFLGQMYASVPTVENSSHERSFFRR